MRVKSLYLENFGIIKKEHFNFSDGLFVFNGNNGEGKSTVLKAISLVLFNRVPGKMSDYINWGSNLARVDIEFSHNGASYQTGIIISEKGNERYFKDLSTFEELNTNSAVTEKLNDILDIKRIIASTTCFEHEIDLISTSPSERREYLKKVYDLSFKAETEKIVSDIDNTEKNILETKGKIDGLKAQSFEKYELIRPPFSEDTYISLKNSINQNKLFTKNKEQELQKKSEALSNITYEKKELLQLKSDYEFNLVTIEELKSQILLQEEKIEKINNIDFSLIEEGFNQQLKLLTEEENSLLKDQSELKTLIEKTLPVELSNLDFSEEIIKKVNEELFETKFQINELENTFSQLSSGICPVCKKPYESHNLTSMEEEIFSLKQKKTKLEEESQVLKEKQSKGVAIEKQIQLAENSLEKNNSKLENLLTKKNSIQDSKNKEILYKKEEQKKEIQHLKEIISTNQNLLTEKIKSLDIIKEKIKSFDNLEQKEIELEQNIKELKIELYELSEAIAESETKIRLYEDIKNSNEEKNKINESLSKKEKERNDQVCYLEKELSDYSENLNTYKLSLKLLTKDFPSFVLSRLVNNLKEYTNEFLKQVYPKYEIEFKESKTALAITYNNGTDVKLASGFEKQIFSFAYKYALGKVQNYGILFLDEVDSAASEENSKLFYETLAKMQSFFSQIFIITHKDSVKELLKNDYSANIFTIQNGKIL